MDFCVERGFPSPNPPRNDNQVHEPLNLKENRATFFCLLENLGPGVPL